MEVVRKYPDLTTNVVSDAITRWCIIQQRVYTPGPLRTPVHNPRIVVKEVARQEATFAFEVHFGYERDRGSVSDDRFDVLLRTLLPGSGYELCPGLPDDVRTQLTFECKNARKWGFPFNRIDHTQCELWYHVHTDLGRIKREPTCEKCSQLLRYCKVQLKRRAKVTPAQKAKRTLPSSTCNLRYLSPASKRVRLQRRSMESFQSRRKLQSLKYRKYDVNPNDATHSELLRLVAEIQHSSPEKLEELLTEADRAGKGDILRNKWKQDVEERLAFEKDQQRNGKAYPLYSYSCAVDVSVYLSCVCCSACRCFSRRIYLMSIYGG